MPQGKEKNKERMANRRAAKKGDERMEEQKRMTNDIIEGVAEKFGDTLSGILLTMMWRHPARRCRRRHRRGRRGADPRRVDGARGASLAAWHRDAPTHRAPLESNAAAVAG